MKEIVIDSPKYGRQVVVVDDEDFNTVSKHRWFLHKSRRTFYALAKVPISNKNIRMHRLILGVSDEKQVDHKDQNGLNNTRSNLRICTKTENNRNVGLMMTNKTGFKGVFIDQRRRDKKFFAKLRANHTEYFLGSYHTAQEAALAYNLAARKHFGEFAYLNELPNDFKAFGILTSSL